MDILYWILGVGCVIFIVIAFLLYKQKKAIDRINKEYEDFNN